MKIRIKTKPMKSMRYCSVGDWQFLPDGTLLITVADMGNPYYEFLVARHEMDEAILCRKRGLTTEDVDKFDMAYEGDGEPGDDPASPYHKEHAFATDAEMPMAKELGVDLAEYDRVLDLTYEQWEKKA